MKQVWIKPIPTKESEDLPFKVDKPDPRITERKQKCLGVIRNQDGQIVAVVHH